MDYTPQQIQLFNLDKLNNKIRDLSAKLQKAGLKKKYLLQLETALHTAPIKLGLMFTSIYKQEIFLLLHLEQSKQGF